MFWDTVAEGLGSITFILAYIAFLFAAVGLANTSRQRWEDLTLQKEQGASSVILEKARKQAKIDFCAWHFFIFLISVAVLAVLMRFTTYGYMEVIPLLWCSLVVVIFGGIFCSVTFICELGIFRDKSLESTK